jgi:hypothetical protein
MTGKAAGPRINLIVSPAIKHSIGLKANIVDAALPRHKHHLIEAAMAGPTEFLRQGERVHFARIKDLQPLRAIGHYRRKVPLSRSVTRFASNSGNQRIQM